MICVSPNEHGNSAEPKLYLLSVLSIKTLNFLARLMQISFVLFHIGRFYPSNPDKWWPSSAFAARFIKLENHIAFEVCVIVASKATCVVLYDSLLKYGSSLFDANVSGSFEKLDNLHSETYRNKMQQYLIQVQIVQ